MENEQVVIVGQQPWDTDIGSNCKNIAIELSKKNRVLYVNSPLDRITLLRNRSDPKVLKRLNVIKGREPGLVKVADNLWNLYPDCMVESINWIPNSWMFNLLNKRNNRSLAKSIKAAVKALHFDNYLLFNDNEIFKGFYLKDLLKPKQSIYYSRDYMLGVDYWRRHGERLEPLLIAKSDLCFSNSTYLQHYCLRYNPRSFYVGQGCDMAIIQSEDCLDKPQDIKHLTSPILGYVGSLDSNRLDIELIAYIARCFPDYLVVLVGPEDEGFLQSALHSINNILFLGKKPVDQLSRYIGTFDVCLNPQVVNPITVGNYPRKIDEYLAMGKPTVATYTQTMEAFSEVVYLASTKEEYIRQIRCALDEDHADLQALRKEFVAGHTWENSVSEMTKAILNHMQ